MVVIWTKTVKTQLKYFSINSHYGKVKEYIKEMIKYVSTLENFEELGMKFGTYNTKQVRQLIYKKHRIFYHITSGRVFILSVIHIAQDLAEINRLLDQLLK